jgi:hypothetical protein
MNAFSASATEYVFQGQGGTASRSPSTDWAAYVDPTRLAANGGGMQLVTQRWDRSRASTVPALVSIDENGNRTYDPSATGVFYLAPNITNEDVGELRRGNRLADKHAEFTFYYQERSQTGEMVWKEGFVRVTAQDYAATGREVFFGDRPLSNPGYSQMQLRGTVGLNQANDRLDVFKVEQRLRYLGFPALGHSRGSAPNATQDFNVDGTWGHQEAKAAYLFARVVNYGGTNVAPAQAGTGNTAMLVTANRVGTQTFVGATYDTQLSAASSAMTIASNGRIFEYLNAWNAPHWVNVGQIASNLPSWVNTQDGSEGRVENWGTSWMSDWFVAEQFALPGFQTTLPLLFNGATDANHRYTPGAHRSHDLGMAFDIGIKPRLVNGVQVGAPIADSITTSAANTWRMSQLSSAPGAVANQWSDLAALWYVQADPTTTGVRNRNTADADGSYRLATGTWQNPTNPNDRRLNEPPRLSRRLVGLSQTDVV